MALTREQLEDAVREHVGAEAERDLDHLRATLEEDVAYEIMSPDFADSDDPRGRFVGADAYIDMWRRLYETFESYEIELQDVSGDEINQRAWLRVQVTAKPFGSWEGLPAGRALRWWAAAICEFAPDGRMTKEIVYGSFPPTMAAYRRMLDA